MTAIVEPEPKAWAGDGRQREMRITATATEKMPAEVAVVAEGSFVI